MPRPARQPALPTRKRGDGSRKPRSCSERRNSAETESPRRHAATKNSSSPCAPMRSHHSKERISSGSIPVLTSQRSSRLRASVISASNPTRQRIPQSFCLRPTRGDTERELESDSRRTRRRLRAGPWVCRSPARFRRNSAFGPIESFASRSRPFVEIQFRLTDQAAANSPDRGRRARAGARRS